MCDVDNDDNNCELFLMCCPKSRLDKCLFAYWFNLELANSRLRGVRGYSDSPHAVDQKLAYKKPWWLRFLTMVQIRVRHLFLKVSFVNFYLIIHYHRTSTYILLKHGRWPNSKLPSIGCFLVSDQSFVPGTTVFNYRLRIAILLRLVPSAASIGLVDLLVC